MISYTEIRFYGKTARTLVNIRKIEVILIYAKKNKSPHGLPRHSSFMIMHTFAEWGNTGQNMAGSLGITTV